MMPLSMLREGATGTIKELHGKPEMKKHLEDLRFISGDTVRVVSQLGGNLIIEVKGTRLAVNKVMANHVILAD